MELGAMPVSVSLLPCRLAPLALRTARDGIIWFCDEPIGFFAGWLMASSAMTAGTAQNMPAATRAMQAIRFLIMDGLLVMWGAGE
jgi:hypothetical protein